MCLSKRPFCKICTANPKQQSGAILNDQNAVPKRLQHRLLNESKRFVIQTLYQIDFRDYKAYLDLLGRSLLDRSLCARKGYFLEVSLSKGCFFLKKQATLHESSAAHRSPSVISGFRVKLLRWSSMNSMRSITFNVIHCQIRNFALPIENSSIIFISARQRNQERN